MTITEVHGVRTSYSTHVLAVLDDGKRVILQTPMRDFSLTWEEAIFLSECLSASADRAAGAK